MTSEDFKYEQGGGQEGIPENDGRETMGGHSMEEVTAYYGLEAQKTAEVVEQLAEGIKEEFPDNDFHNIEHPINVEKEGRVVFDVIDSFDPSLVDREERLSFKPSVIGHDAVVRYVDSLGGIRLRARVQNEKESAEKIKRTMLKVDPEYRVFTRRVHELVDENLDATIPKSDFESPIDPQNAVIDDPGKTGEKIDLAPYLRKNEKGDLVGLEIDQENLTEKSAISALAIAVGDLSYGGIVDFEEFKKRGNQECRELFEKRKFQLRNKIGELPPGEKAAIADELLAWIKTQVGFALHQKIRFDRIVESNGKINKSPQAENIKADFRRRFSNFDANIIASRDRLLQAEERYGALRDAASYPANDELFKELAAEEMGFTLGQQEKPAA